MAYSRTTWLPRLGTALNKFRKSEESIDYVTLVNTPDSITQEGTPFSAVNMNNIEDGIEESRVGWLSANETWTYASADSPTFTFTISGDKTGKYSKGMKLRLVQSATLKYFIISITPTYSSGTGLTTVTVYGGTDYTLANSTISNNYYSIVQQPFGFDRSPNKWSVLYVDETTRTQTSPTNGTFYNIGSLSVSLPIGEWEISMQATIGGILAGNIYNVYVALSTSPSSFSTNRLKALGVGYANWALPVHRVHKMSLTAKTTWYVVMFTAAGLTLSSMYLDNGATPLIIRAQCVDI